MKHYFISSLERSNNNQRMHPTLKLIMWMSVFLLILAVENVYSQGDTLNCWDFQCTAQWSDTNTIVGNMGSGITGVIKYRRRICNGIEHFVVDEFKAFDNGLYLDTVRVYHYNYTAFSDLVDIYLLQRVYEPTTITTSVDTPRVLVQIYKASCGVWVQCTYQIDSLFTQCDSGYVDPFPHYTRLQSLPIYKWQSCGSVCCKKTYEVYKTLGTSNHVILKVKSITIERSPCDSTCTEQYKYTKPCEDGC